MTSIAAGLPDTSVVKAMAALTFSSIRCEHRIVS